MSSRYLTLPLRRALEKTVMDARIVAEEGARDAIRRLGVAIGKAPAYLNGPERELRRRLRAHARALGDAFDRKEDIQETKRLIESAAYAHWHRMLFARFLAERSLLRNPEHDVAVTLEDCRELAEAEGLTDAWAVAERYAAAMLPAVFRVDDPVLALNFDPVHTQKLHKAVTGLDAEVFQAEDSLGWTYQFWRAAEKDAVNKSGVKIGADELPAVTQLFTEPYMVRFLLHNTLGAWWAAKVLAADPKLAATAANENELRSACSLPGYTFDMLRFARESKDDSWRPAAGTFPGWPAAAKAVTVLDPCCGSGHFLTEALAILAAVRQLEELLSPTDAVAAVLRDNLHGLEIDERCVQIAAFAVALTAWRIGGWQTLPLPQIAWVGAPPPLPKREFVALAGGDVELESALGALHDLFALAPILGSLVKPSGGDLFESEKMSKIEQLLEPLLARARLAEPEGEEGVIAARGMVDSARLLLSHYTLISTNVPYLGSRKQSAAIADYLGRRLKNGKADLASAVQLRCDELLSRSGTFCAVTKHEILFQQSYQSLRREWLEAERLVLIAVIGENGFDSPAAAGAFVTLIVVQARSGKLSSSYSCLNAFGEKSPELKAKALHEDKPIILNQINQLKNPLSRILTDHSTDQDLPRLSDFCETYQGIKSGDDPRFIRKFWEGDLHSKTWRRMQSTVLAHMPYGGADSVIWWGADGRHLTRRREEGQLAAKAMRAVSVGQMRDLPCSILATEAFDSNVSPIFAKNAEDFPAVLAFCTSDDYREAVRRLEPSIKANNTALIAVPFDIKRWRKAAETVYLEGPPEPFSSDPTQWLFHGHPERTDKGTALHVALARLCGYRWPAEVDPGLRLSSEARDWIAKASALPSGDSDGLLGVPAVAGERSLADRLRAYLAASFGAQWSDALERQLVEEADEALDKKKARDSSLDSWLYDRAFRQHCVLFGQRPFLWHVSDGLKGGFSIFVHYHRFGQANLSKLTYTMLGDWLARAKVENNALRYEKARELQQILEKVLEGEKPYDIFVRWKSLAQQPLGWEPDLDDGVRQNIRPFIEAGVLTYDLSKILKDKDRGTDVATAPWYGVFKGERRNDHHTKLAEKRAARKGAKTPK